jgi:hypothetical protein
MFKMNKDFDNIAQRALEINARLGKHRFHTIFQANKRFVTVGLYDSQTKRYEMFDSVNFAGNYRYDKNVKPDEFYKMESMLKAAF